MWDVRRKLVSASAAAGLLCLMASCASVSVRKVPTPTQYENWSDTLQAKADKMKGIRFYLPRPFVNVFESFPIATDVYLVDGIVSPDGEYIIIQNVRGDSELARYFASRTLSASGEYSITVPTKVIRRTASQSVLDALAQRAARAIQESATVPTEPSAVEAAKRQLAEAVKEAETAGANVEEQSASAEKAAAEAQAEAERAKQAAQAARRGAEQTQTQKRQTGTDSRAVTNDNAAFAMQPLRGNFDIVYLPDFEEQYVVSSRAGLGNAQFQLNLGQGWSLQGFNSLTDNSALNERIFKLIDTAMELGTGLAKAAAGIPPIDMGASRAIAESATVSVDEIGVSGTPVTVKIVVVHYAAKGLYPVIKPRELKDAKPDSYIIDPFDDQPRVRRVDQITSPEIQAAIDSYETTSGRFTVPVYPYQYISFNTFRYMAIELVTKSGAPFGTLYDRTGVTGATGAARTSDAPTGDAGAEDVSSETEKSLDPDLVTRIESAWADLAGDSELRRIQVGTVRDLDGEVLNVFGFIVSAEGVGTPPASIEYKIKIPVELHTTRANEDLNQEFLDKTARALEATNNGEISTSDEDILANKSGVLAPDMQVVVEAEEDDASDG